MDKGQAIHCNSTAITTWASNHCPRLQRTPAFANAAGAIDGCHIRIKGPGNQHRADYINYKLFPFIQRPSVMQETDFLMYLWAIQAWYMMQGVFAMVFYKALYPPPWRMPILAWKHDWPFNTIQAPSAWSKRDLICIAPGLVLLLNELLEWWKHAGRPHY